MAGRRSCVPGLKFTLAMVAALMLLLAVGGRPTMAAKIDEQLSAASAKIDTLAASGQLKAAVSLARRLAASAAKALPTNDPRLVIYGAQLADLYDRLGDTNAVTAELTRAQGRLAAGVADKPELIDALRTIARLAAKAGQFDAAEQLLTRALAIAEDNGGPDAPQVADLRHQLADVYDQHGRKADADSLREQIRIAEEATAMAAREKAVAAEAEAKAAESQAAQPPAGGAPSDEEQAAPTSPAPPPPPVTTEQAQPKEEALPVPEPNGSSKKHHKLSRGKPLQAQPPAAGEEAAAEYHVVQVFYGTNRKRSNDVSRVSFTSEENDALDLGVANITVPNTHIVPQVERPWSLRVPGTDVVITFEAQDPSKHFTIKSIEALSEDQFIAGAKAQLATSQTYKGQALVFVHGFYNTFDDALYRTAQIAYDMQFDGATFMFSWPSAGALEAYWQDQPKAEHAGAKLRAFLDMIAHKTGATRISVIAHSMGNLPLLEALDEAITPEQPSPVASIDEVVLAAPDIGRKEFTAMIEHMQHVRGGITLYAASNDLALEASRTLNHEPRAGDSGFGGPLLLPHVDTIDATRASTQIFRLNHFYVAESSAILCDVEHLLRTGMRPPNERSKILELVKDGAGTYYAYRP